MRLMFLIIIFICLHSTAAMAKDPPCAMVHEGVTEIQKTKWNASINRQIGGRLVSINQAYSWGDWVIVFVDAKDADPPFLFFHGNPVKVHYTTMWSGAAMRSETASMTAWVRKNAPGIPDPLARCFAWHVTQGQDSKNDFGRR